MRILCTGAGGYIGSVLVPELLKHHDVTALDTFRHENTLAASCASDGLRVVRGDARCEGIMRPLLGMADVVIPLAAVVGAPACDADPVGAYTTNYEAIDWICNFTSRARIIIPITNSGYGIGEHGECTEESPLDPVSYYGQTKVLAEKRVMERPDSVSLRLATVFGMSPRMRLDLLVNDFVYRAMNDRALVLFEADFRRNYVHVRDVARAFVHVIDNWEKMRGQVYNVGDSRANMSKGDLALRVKQYVPELAILDSPLSKDQDRRDYIVSNAKIEATGFRCAHSLDDGIRELMKGYQTMRANKYANT